MEFYLTIIILLLLPVILLKTYVILNTTWNNSPKCLVGKTAIVTGANTGVGFYTALDFAKRGARVILACRDENKAEKAKSIIVEETGNTNVIVKLLDLTSLKSIRNFVDEINNTEQCLHILVNNAGILNRHDVVTEDGLEVSMQTNHFGPFLLTILLTGLLKRSAPSRVVSVSSTAIYFAHINVDKLRAFNGWKLQNYGNSKLCNLISSNELAKRLKGSNVTVNTVDPGFVYTAMARGFVSDLIDHRIFSLVLKTPEEGAQTTIYAAVSKDLEGVTGRFIDHCGIKNFLPIPRVALDEEFRGKIWEKSIDLVKLTPDEIKL